MINPDWLELPMSRIHLQGPKDVRAIEDLLLLKHCIRYYDTLLPIFTKGTELTVFGQLKIHMKISINLNLKTFRLLHCLHIIFLHCILRYLIIL